MALRILFSRRPRLRAAAGTLALVLVPLLAGCASLNAYRRDADLLQGRFTTIENYGTEAVDPAQVDHLLLEVAEILGVTLDPAVPRPRIVVTSPGRIARLYSSASATFPGHPRAVALYFPRASLILVPYFDRTLLGHELAHYLTEHYLEAPRSRWEKIARDVEWKLLTARPRPSEALTASSAGPPPAAEIGPPPDPEAEEAASPSEDAVHSGYLLVADAADQFYGP